jgi:hypothetical protein
MKQLNQNLADPLSAMIEATLERVIDRAIPKIASAIPAPPAAVPAKIRSTSKFDDLPDDAFIVLKDAATLFGAHRTTMLRMEFQKKLPPRRMRGGKSGWLLGQLREVLRNLPQTRQRQKRLATAS